MSRTTQSRTTGPCPPPPVRATPRPGPARPVSGARAAAVPYLLHWTDPGHPAGATPPPEKETDR
ncbi:hypothetical protein ACFQVA_28390 [Actinomadura keratinilytica]